MTGTVPNRFLVYLCVSLLALSTGSAVARSLKGKVKKGVYYSPANNFTVPVTKGWDVKVNDSYDKKKGIGAVSMHDVLGSLDSIHYMMVPPEFQARIQEMENKEHFLLDWLQKELIPGWYLPAAPESRILREATGPFEGMPAAFALVDIPGGSHIAVTSTSDGKTRRADSCRGLVVFLKGRYIYSIATETTSAVCKKEAGAVEPDKNGMPFAEALRTFYKSIAFPE